MTFYSIWTMFVSEYNLCFIQEVRGNRVNKWWRNKCLFQSFFFLIGFTQSWELRTDAAVSLPEQENSAAFSWFFFFFFLVLPSSLKGSAEDPFLYVWMLGFFYFLFHIWWGGSTSLSDYLVAITCLGKVGSSGCGWFCVSRTLPVTFHCYLSVRCLSGLFQDGG